MAKISARLVRAVEKNLNDLSNAILQRRAYNEFMELRTAHSLDFFRIAIHALHDNLYADAHRVFDTHKDAASICYIRRVAPGLFNKAVAASGVSVPDLEKIAAKLLLIRNRVQAHTNRKDVEVPARVWTDANLTGNEFIRLTEESHDVLRRVYFELTGENREVPAYFGKDIEPILRAYETAVPNAPIRVRGRKI